MVNEEEREEEKKKECGWKTGMWVWGNLQLDAMI